MTDRMAEEWPERALSAFGLESEAITATAPGRVSLRLGTVRACLWRSSLTGDAHARIAAWERMLGGHGLMAVRLQPRGGGWHADLGEGMTAVLTAWDGCELGRTARLDQAARIAAFIGRVHRLAGESGLPAPVQVGRDWLESCAEDAGRLALFARLAAGRMHATRFDRVFLEQAHHYIRAGEEALGRLAAAWNGQAPGLALNWICRNVFFQGRHGLALKTGLGLAPGVPIRDLCRLLLRYLPGLRWSMEAGMSIIAAYCAERRPAPGEIRLLQAGLSFPAEFFDLARGYYLNLRPWPLRRFLRRQAAAWRREAARRRFVEELPSLVS